MVIIREEVAIHFLKEAVEYCLEEAKECSRLGEGEVLKHLEVEVS